MELELGLALNISGPMQRLDLNKHWFEPDMGSSDGMRQDDPTQIQSSGYKRLYKLENAGLEISLGASGQKMMLPLVSWNEEPNEKDGNGALWGKSSCQLVSHLKNLEDEDNYVKGWPPIQSWRKKFLASCRNRNQACRGSNSNSNSMYIKVKMEGIAIARKINLRCFDSYDALFNCLMTMFAKYTGNGDGSTSMSEYYTLKFQDREGNWLLSKDAPWQTLVDRVRQVEIRRKSGE